MTTEDEDAWEDSNDSWFAQVEPHRHAHGFLSPSEIAAEKLAKAKRDKDAKTPRLMAVLHAVALPIAHAHARPMAGAAPHSVQLKKLLNATFALAQRTQNFHWNVRGPLFPQLHDLFGSQYEHLNEAVDEIAEHIRAQGEPAAAVDPINAHADAEPPNAHTMVRLLTAQHDACASLARELAKQAESRGDAATVDLAGRRALSHEKCAWILRSIM